MNTQEQFAQMEHRIQSLERRATRYRLALVAVLLALVGVVLVGATGDKDAEFDTVTAKTVMVENGAGEVVAFLSADEDGGFFSIFNNAGEVAGLLSASENGGLFSIRNNAGKTVAGLTADENGGFFSIYNKTGETIIQAYADEDGNGLVGAYNRKGKGRTLEPGP
jgi:hypothetical protein